MDRGPAVGLETGGGAPGHPDHEERLRWGVPAGLGVPQRAVQERALHQGGGPPSPLPPPPPQSPGVSAQTGHPCFSASRQMWSDVDVSDVGRGAGQVHVLLGVLGLRGDAVLLGLAEAGLQEGLDLLLARPQTVLQDQEERQTAVSQRADTQAAASQREDRQTAVSQRADTQPPVRGRTDRQPCDVPGRCG